MAHQAATGGEDDEGQIGLPAIRAALTTIALVGALVMPAASSAANGGAAGAWGGRHSAGHGWSGGQAQAAHTSSPKAHAAVRTGSDSAVFAGPRTFTTAGHVGASSGSTTKDHSAKAPKGKDHTKTPRAEADEDTDDGADEDGDDGDSEDVDDGDDEDSDDGDSEDESDEDEGDD